MSLTTRLAAAEDGLLAAIIAGAPAGVPVTLGDPGATVPAEGIWISEDATAEQVSDLSSQSNPAGGREETFELRVIVFTSLPGDDYLTLRNRGITLCAVVETAVAGSRTLGGAVEDSQVVRIERNTGATTQGRALEQVVYVLGRAWLA